MPGPDRVSRQHNLTGSYEIHHERPWPYFHTHRVGAQRAVPNPCSIPISFILRTSNASFLDPKAQNQGIRLVSNNTSREPAPSAAEKSARHDDSGSDA